VLHTDGQAEAWLATATDVHELQQALKTAQQNAEHLRLAAQAAQLGVYSFDLQTRDHQWSPELKAIFGLPPDAAAPDDVLKVIHPDDRERFAAYRQRTREPESSGAFQDEHRIVRADGSVRWVLVKGSISFVGEGPQRTARRGVGVVLDITERKEAEARQTLLVRELQHRTKNLLAVIQSIATNSLKKGTDVDTFVGRLHALARAQEFVAAGPQGGVPLRQLVDEALAAFGSQAAVEGDDAVVGGGFAQTFALVLHELATNAAKYGSLSTPHGRVTITWSIITLEGDPHLQFCWRECNGPRVQPPAATGFGTQLMSSFSRAEAAFNESGFAYQLVIPLLEIAAVP
jgi:PAS domain S-box-containing protein